MGKRSKQVLIMFVFLCLWLTAATSASAYSRIGGCLNYPPFYKYYWCLSDTYIPNVGQNAEVDLAMSRWNNTENTKVWMKKTSTKSSSILDFYFHPFADINVLGCTFFYRNYTMVEPSNNNWSWCEIRLNSAFNWSKVLDPNGNPNPPKVFSATAAHEIGHAFGLEELIWFWQDNALMYQNTAFFTNHGIYSPTSDEIAGVQAIYGTLY